MKNLVPFLNSSANKRHHEYAKQYRHFFDYGGYANGYVAVPPEHPWYGKSYDEVEDKIDIHGGLTFSAKTDECCGWNDIETIDDDSNLIPLGWWVFGFDTLHAYDNLENWPKERCIEETLNLKRQLEEVWKKRN